MYRFTVYPGDEVSLELPYSEVCMSMRVAGTVRTVCVLEDAAQILNPSGTPFSAPITHGEAGIYRDGSELYVTKH